ncbi:Uncharacterized membrane protein YgdD, TMEM256/DUF423 family [Evansella caseinilytica]|uniref:Uncharacterized membrane protein YgdD, TMEM256/DUF423 family n=1 Tax=Evansella caseinilytica TaxID=1503961 RepID=A0A1H3UWM8_9BACI|nr:DUF423 domain-containing protein [Evansella caseinilytica]SDZ66823.1 Uncharacterized membrane protein YgdD, TMEM256/DUF423 family [Evansella caseinilytica]
MAKLFFILGSINGFLFVALGAFGAHALKPRLEAGGYLETYQTAVQYQMVHTLAIIAVAILIHYSGATGLLNGAGWAFFIGIVLFSGSLYALSITGISVLGAITPIGGVAFLAGWAMLLMAAIK